MWGPSSATTENDRVGEDSEPLINGRQEERYTTIELRSPHTVSFPLSPILEGEEDIKLSPNIREYEEEETSTFDFRSPALLDQKCPSFRAASAVMSFVFKVTGTLFCTLLSGVIIAGLVTHTIFPLTEVSNTEEAGPVCSSESWSNGRWIKRNETTPPLSSFRDILKWSGFPTYYCTSNRLPKTNLGTPWNQNDTAELWDWRGKVSGYTWQPGCQENEKRLKPQYTPQSLLNDLVYEGGWLFIGDSLSAQWFLSLSCILAPYVRATPFWTPEVPWNATQHLYLDHESPYVQQMELPEGFNMNVTPVVTILRSGLLLSKPEITKIIDDKDLLPGVGPINWNETVFDNPTSLYLDHFLNPNYRYSKLVASAGAHYTSKLFMDLPLDKVTSVFHHVFEEWIRIISKMLEDPRAKDKKVFYRTATAGHKDCHLPEKLNGPPLNEEEALDTPIYNWQFIPIFNRIAQAAMSKVRHPRFKFLSLDRPAMLRPDSHILIDCLHFTIGTGVVEGWTDFLYSYV
ncbi:hypothetical protein CROQUDRAFT_669192 [Cronartium quercuum f. sp. fusiforme G11]|uniref:Uncharacterized protein n=1 Tax=Cronartium quercuum f. sp. fusiforme G11 TaxID=708437 RepID=A0A9P6TG78_9BASI|nr:hypothetical protein CROQUDRAFT_669192 [Cronartium quercuum f. sp. fusiforme G11]